MVVGGPRGRRAHIAAAPAAGAVLAAEGKPLGGEREARDAAGDAGNHLLQRVEEAHVGGRPVSPRSAPLSRSLDLPLLAVTHPRRNRRT